MRPTNATQLTAIASANRAEHLRIWLEDSEGVMRDMTALEGVDWLDECTIEASEDEPIASGVVTFWREVGALSLAPLMEASAVNRDSVNAYGPLIVPGRRVEIQVATMLAGQTPAAGDWVLLLEGVTDDPAWGGARARISASLRDPMAELHDTMIEVTRTYGNDASPVPIESVMQDILDDNIGAGAWPLRVIGTPDFGITAYELGNVSVLEALRALADLQGWNLRFLWSVTHGEFRLTYYEPARAAVTPLHTFAPDDYYHVHDVRLEQRGIRNVGELLYVKVDGSDDIVTGVRQLSIDSYGRRFLRLDERGGVIRTAAQAQEMLDAILDDTNVPPIAQHIEAAFFWPVECGDLYRFAANGTHYDTDQDWAVFGYRHTLTLAKCRTDIFVRGQASGGFERWHRERPPTQYRPTLLVTSSESDNTGITFHFQRRCTSVWVYMRTVAIGADLGAIIYTAGDLVAVLATETEYKVLFPAAGFERHVLFEPHGQDSASIGEGRQFVVPGPGVSPSWVDPTHTEAGAVGTFGVTLSDPTSIATEVYVRSKSGADPFSGWQLVTAAPADGATYSSSVALIEGHQSYVEFRGDYLLQGEALSAHVLSAGMDFGNQANVTQLNYEFRGNRLWVTALGDSDTRVSGIILVGVRAASKTVEPTLAVHDFDWTNPAGVMSRGGAIDTGIDIADPGTGLTVVGFIGVAAINLDGVEGPTVWINYQRVGGESSATLVVNSFDAADITLGTACSSDPDRCLLSWDVTAPAGHTVTVERVVDGDSTPTTIFAGAVLVAVNQTDELPWFQNPPTIAPRHHVQYHLLVKDGSSVIVLDAWSAVLSPVFGVIDCA